MPYVTGTLKKKYSEKPLKTTGGAKTPQGWVGTIGEALELIAKYVLEGTHEDSVIGDKGLLANLNSADLAKIDEKYMTDWFNGNTDDEPYYQEMDKNAQARMTDVLDKLRGYRLEKDRKAAADQKALSAPPADPSVRGAPPSQPSRPRVFANLGAQVAVPSLQKEDPVIAEKNERIIAVINRRLEEILKEEDSSFNHTPRKEALRALILEIKKDPKIMNNKTLINAEVIGEIEAAVRRSYLLQGNLSNSEIGKKIKEFDKGIDPITSVPGKRLLGKKSQYAKMKEEIDTIAKSTLDISTSKDSKKRPGRQ